MQAATVKYQKNQQDQLFFSNLKKRVSVYTRTASLEKEGRRVITAKSILFLSLFFSSYGLLISNRFSPNITLLFGIICGLATVFIVFNISHDASHNCLFRSRRLNKLMTYTLYLVGGNAYCWDITHNKIHHSYPNVADTDPDIYQAAPFIRVSPAAPFRSYHRYQAYYAPLLYLTHSLYLVFIKDFQDFRLLPKKSFSLPEQKHPGHAYILLFATKCFYLFYSLILPLVVLDIAAWKIIAGYLFIHLLMSFLLSAVLIPVHMVDGNDFPRPGNGQLIGQSWVRSIFSNTIDYSARSRLANFFFGGLNTHLAHHLFPQVCHVHLVGVTRIIKEEAGRFGIPYHDVSMWGAIRAHFRLLKRMSLPVS